MSTPRAQKTLESPLDCKEIQPVHSEGDQPWDFFGRNDAKAETPVLWPPYVKSWLIGKDSDAGRDWGQEEKGMTEDEMAGWHHWLDGRESEWTLGDGDGQGGLACCDSWGRKESNTTEQLNWTENPDLGFWIPFFSKKEQGFLGKWLTPCQGHRKYKVSLKTPIVSIRKTRDFPGGPVCHGLCSDWKRISRHRAF